YGRATDSVLPKAAGEPMAGTFPCLHGSVAPSIMTVPQYQYGFPNPIPFLRLPSQESCFPKPWFADRGFVVSEGLNHCMHLTYECIAQQPLTCRLDIAAHAITKDHKSARKTRLKRA
ncbi:hypothetical protein, partial [Pseudomonas aeruginosa]|uniref:hypothetical protein n=2 Tax=Pseudomonas aeruginosa TaxID=287 RepID=UPI0023588822